MRVLFVVNTFPPSYTGGAEVANYHSCRGLMRQGVDCSILVLNNRVPAVDEWYELDGIPVHRVARPRPRHAFTDILDPVLYRVVAAELRRLKPDLVHIHNVSGATLSPYLACRHCGVPVVNTLHDLWLLCPNNMLYRRDGSYCDPRVNPVGCQQCFRRYDFWGAVPYRRQVFAALTSNVKLFLSPSQAVIERHVEAGYERERFRLARLGFEESSATVRPDSCQRWEHDSALPPTLMFGGGGIETKGARVLLDALPQVFEAIPNLRVLVAGGGEERFLAQYRKHSPHVQVLGPVPFVEMRSLFVQADLALVPSVWHENSPVTIFESYQMGTPVAGSSIGGIPEFIRDGETGYLFETGNARALADVICRHFSRSAYERRQMRLACVRESRDRLTYQNHINRLLDLYREALEN